MGRPSLTPRRMLRHSAPRAPPARPGREDTHRGHPKGSAPTGRMHSPTCSAKPSGESYKIELQARIKNLREGSNARLLSPCSSAYAQFSLQHFVQTNSQHPKSEHHWTALTSHPKTGKRVFLHIRHPMLAPLPTAKPNPAGARQHCRTKTPPERRVFHSETLSSGAGVPGRDRGCRGGEHSVHIRQQEVGGGPTPQHSGDQKNKAGF